ncbi:cytochrome c oxidase subunit II [Guptibacillus algicola]|uniref:cytochrome c oxidase subunit II n=1 Tax=Guptibacillus algicola TaxID=225844 RepID=UPI001CD335A9|nr:cytochrome c oxidase subunit II [Alkalihalobacillus algicola]MCA0985895.1 cytochrome c oxidase subunit II [Alkalihalobacillus algicola]
MKRVLTFIVTACILSGCSSIAVLNPKGTAGEKQLDLLLLSLLLMGIVLAVVFTLFVRFLIKYREKPGEENEFPIQTAGNKKLEISWIVVPFIIIIVLAIPTFATTYELDEPYTNDKKPLIIEVTGEQFQWSFYYPEYGITSTDELRLPVNRPISFKLTSNDVIHSFWIPQLGGKRDALPGKENTLRLKALETGTYDGKCAELCGAEHALMTFDTIVENKTNFSKWIENMKDGEKDG